jgi:hypothetical protein
MTKRKPKKRVQPMTVIPEPEPGTRSVLHLMGEGTVVMRGGGGFNLVMTCGNCGAHLVEGVPTANIRDMVLKCNQCGSFNATLA